MSTFGFGPEMIDFRTVLAAASLLGFALVLSLAAEIGARGRRASNAKASLPLVGSPQAADDARTRDVALASTRAPLIQVPPKATTRSSNEP
jgi:hypothetical protein